MKPHLRCSLGLFVSLCGVLRAEASLAQWDLDRQPDPSDNTRVTLKPSTAHMEVEVRPIRAGKGVQGWRVRDAQKRLDDPVLLLFPAQDLSGVGPDRGLAEGSFFEFSLKGRFDSLMVFSRLSFDVAVGGSSGSRAWVLRSSVTGERDLLAARPEKNVWDLKNRVENDGLRRVELDLKQIPEFEMPLKQVTFTLIYLANGKQSQGLIVDNLHVDGQVVGESSASIPHVPDRNH